MQHRSLTLRISLIPTDGTTILKYDIRKRRVNTQRVIEQTRQPSEPTGDGLEVETNEPAPLLSTYPVRFIIKKSLGG
ncbi:unnamed protein product [Colias eurytheme]|nr:unnamed protein product [Colias eurytheme]